MNNLLVKDVNVAVLLTMVVDQNLFGNFHFLFLPSHIEMAM